MPSDEARVVAAHELLFRPYALARCAYGPFQAGL